MIKLSDVALLSLTKLHTRKVRTVITVLLTSMLFGVLVAVSLVTTGMFRSVDSFRSGGLTSRYIVQVDGASTHSDIFIRATRDPVLVTEAKKRFRKIVQEKSALAKQLGLSYTSDIELPPYQRQEDGTESLSTTDSNGIAEQILKEKFATQVAFDETKLQEIAKRYGAKEIFRSQGHMVKPGSSLITLKDGKETFYDKNNDAERQANYDVQIIDSGYLTVAPDEITKAFMFPGNAGWQPDGQSLPIILSQDKVEYLLGMSRLPRSASTAQKLQRIKDIRSKAGNLTFQMCYRNDVSQAQIQQAIQQQREISVNKGKKDYQLPSLVYALPDATKCQNAVIVRDVRTNEEKKQEVNQKIFDSRFGKSVAPVSYLVTFKVVGVSPATGNNMNPEQEKQKERSLNVADMVDKVLKVDGVGQTIPLSLYNQLPNRVNYNDILNYAPSNILVGIADHINRYVEFTTARDAQKFIDEQSCETQYDGTCKPSGRLYTAHLAFSNSSAIDDIRKQVRTWLSYAMLVVAILAVAIMWITVGRTIVDGRHETAIFRAIGFKRVDIASIYIVYTMLLSLLVTTCAFGLGIIGAHLLDSQFAPGLTAQARYSFNDMNSAKQISLVSYDWHQLGLIAIICLATGLLSVVLPLIRNVRRSPIRDMREE